MPSVAAVLPDGSVFVGKEALKPENRNQGQIVYPITSIQPSVNRYQMDLKVLRHFFSHIFQELKVNADQYQVRKNLHKKFIF